MAKRKEKIMKLFVVERQGKTAAQGIYSIERTYEAAYDAVVEAFEKEPDLYHQFTITEHETGERLSGHTGKVKGSDSYDHIRGNTVYLFFKNPDGAIDGYI